MMTKYRFNILLECDICVEAQNKDDARMKIINKMYNGDYDQLMNPDASAYVDGGEKEKENE